MARVKKTKPPKSSSAKSQSAKRTKKPQPLKPPRRPYQGLVKNRFPYLPDHLVGDRTRRVWIRLPRTKAKKCMSYCLDCVRLHRIIYCDGETESVAQLCHMHAAKANPKHSTAHYDKIRDALYDRLLKTGLVYNREQTKPILRHRFGCGHGNGYDGFDQNIVAKMETVWQLEQDHAKTIDSDEDADDEGNEDEEEKDGGREKGKDKKKTRRGKKKNRGLLPSSSHKPHKREEAWKKPEPRVCEHRNVSRSGHSHHELERWA